MENQTKGALDQRRTRPQKNLTNRKLDQYQQRTRLKENWTNRKLDQWRIGPTETQSNRELDQLELDQQGTRPTRTRPTGKQTNGELYQRRTTPSEYQTNEALDQWQNQTNRELDQRRTRPTENQPNQIKGVLDLGGTRPIVHQTNRFREEKKLYPQIQILQYDTVTRMFAGAFHFERSRIRTWDWATAACMFWLDQNYRLWVVLKSILPGGSV